MTKKVATTALPNWGMLPETVLAQLKQREWHKLPRLKERLKGEKAFPIIISLKPPKTGNELLNHTQHFHKFVQAWRDFPYASMVQWQHSNFRHFLEQSIPVRVLIPDIQALADVLGSSTRQQLKQWQKRLSFIHTNIAQGMSSLNIENSDKSADKPKEDFADNWQNALFIALIDKLEVIDALSEDDVTLLIKLIPQLRARMGIGSYLRALPVRYVDTKFIETYDKLIEAILDAFYPDPVKDQGLLHWLGCLDRPMGWLMVRPLCANTQSALSGLPILRLPTDVLFKQALPAKRILIVENEQSCLALPRTENTIAIAGGGKNINWMSADWLQRKTVAYWGDIDSEGLMILSRARSYCPKLTAMMMDAQTLTQFRARMVNEPDSPNLIPRHLTADEWILFTDLRQGKYGHRRLEQERLPSEYIAQALREWLTTS